jgi:hypothetical protein
MLWHCLRYLLLSISIIFNVSFTFATPSVGAHNMRPSMALIHQPKKRIIAKLNTQHHHKARSVFCTLSLSPKPQAQHETFLVGAHDTRIIRRQTQKSLEKQAS